MFEVIKSDYDTKIKAIKALKDSYKEKFVKEIAQKLKGSNIEAIQWNQFTAYWEDGSTPFFNVYDPSIKLKGGNEFLTEDYFYSEPDNAAKYDNSAEEAICLEIEKHITSKKMQELMLLMFGDHKTVTITAKGKCKVTPNVDHH